MSESSSHEAYHARLWWGLRKAMFILVVLMTAVFIWLVSWLALHFHHGGGVPL